MRRLIWLPIAGILLIAGAAIAAAAASPSASPSQGALSAPTTAPSSADASPTTATNGTDADQESWAKGNPGHGFFGPDVLDDVLADLVSRGVITQDQADAITSGMRQAISDRHAQSEQEHQQRNQQLQQILGFLSDGVITKDEVDQLPADSAFRKVFDSIAEDGRVTTDQLRELGPGMSGFPGRGHGFGHGWGPGGRHGNGPAVDDDSGTS